MELEWVFFSVTPTAVSASRMALLLTSSSLARSLIRTLLIRPFLYSALRLSLHRSLTEPTYCTRTPSMMSACAICVIKRLFGFGSGTSFRLLLFIFGRSVSFRFGSRHQLTFRGSIASHIFYGSFFSCGFAFNGHNLSRDSLF